MFPTISGGADLTNDTVIELTKAAVAKHGLDQKQLAQTFVNGLKKQELVDLDEALNNAALG